MALIGLQRILLTCLFLNLAACGGGSDPNSDNSTPVIDNQIFSVAENSATGTVIATLNASDADGDALQFAIIAGNLDDAFQLTRDGGELSVENSSAMDYEHHPLFQLTVRVTDTSGASNQATIEVQLIDTTEYSVPTSALPITTSNHRFTSAHFSGSQICADCHNNIQDGSGQDVSIETEWSTSMMANSSRDPFWRAKVASEIRRNPHLAEVLADKCSICHTPMANVEARQQGTPIALFEEGFLNPENTYYDHAMDGVSCTLCHQIEDDGLLGTPADDSGHFNIVNLGISGERIAFGQYAAPQVNPMLSSSGFRPQQGEHMASSEICATCHNLKTPFVDDDGEILSSDHDTEFPEQMVFGEWLNSSLGSGPGKTTCQQCHMPQASDVAIANRPFNLSSRSQFSRHQMLGANTMMLDILNQNRNALGISADGFAETILLTRQFLQTAATLQIVSAARVADELQLQLRIANQTGHKFPTSYPSRRAYIHLTVSNQNGEVIFESGHTRDDGSIQGVDSDASLVAYEPHFNEITRPDQVQVYEAIMGDSEDRVTYTLLRGAHYLKDNRVPPAGFDKFNVPEDIGVFGNASDDDNFNLGQDTVAYRIPLGAGDAQLNVNVELNYQSLAYGFLQDLFNDAEHPEVARFQAMYNTASLRKETLATASLSIP